MTGVCSVCGESVTGQFSYTCSYCDRTHCTDHRLPEKHDCPSLYGRKSFETASDGRPPKPAGHRPTERPESRSRLKTEAGIDLVERTKEKQRQRKTRRDELRDRRKERYSSPDVNPDGSLQTPEYEEDIEAIGETKRTEGPTSNGLLSRSTWFLLALVLVSTLIFVYVWL
ncbi:zinc finger AN1 domain-containing stress-associated protein [Halalkaliarchaeum sp. AArc-GB]|uniref:zinc finger AN1 domain-containing stress-associated protein n=1 Tax=Halalkaliarchaeum sp. AArc-GB TaxID=3074078 RepID=UPI00285919A0|nr:zinc finger AN1 domain-containing stress-associated protein [Halalkaliarchaeum sp. AArc-GB]MDR5673205.1 zinc finger AN1 domain-containing stress-associated protein [Halalkaliarchaeum sp. AArc-GB]